MPKPPPPQRIEIRLDQPKQKLLDQVMERGPATWIGFGGSKGSAKSYGARNVLLRRRFTYPGTVGTIIRRKYKDVKDNHIEPLLAQYPFMRAWYRVQDEELRIPNNSVIRFRYYEARADVEAAGGTEMGDTLVDEAQQFSEIELSMLKGNSRWTGSQIECRMILTFNPGDIGGAFLKRIFYDRRYRDTEVPEDYAFIQAFGWDNVQWARKELKKDGLTADEYYRWDSKKRFEYFITRTAYGRDLNAKPHALRIQWLLGDMGSFVGQYFDNWDEAVHVRPVAPQSWNERSIGIDWGMGHDAAVYWGSQVAPGRYGVYREFVRNGMSPAALAQTVVDMTPGPERPYVKRIGLSHECFSKTEGRDTRAQQMAAVFVQNGLPQPWPAGKDKIGAATLIYGMLQHSDENPPELVIDPSCRELIRVMPTITRDQDDRENTVKFDGDDPFDGLKHLLHDRIGQARKPHDEQVREEAMQITDPFARWQYITKRLQSGEQSVIKPDYNRPVWMG